MRKIYGVTARNEGQTEAVQALVNPDVDLVVLEGVAGSGKTMLALAAGLHQVLDLKRYTDIIFTRAPVGVGEDIGFLPGTEQEKMLPWCGALTDNLEALHSGKEGGKFSKDSAEDVLKGKIKILAMLFMRGRSFHNRYVIIDECQNLTEQQIKVLVSRAGENTKIVLLGDSKQIDNKKTKVDNNGLDYIVKNVYKEEFIKVVHLPCGERSRLATWVGGL